MSLLMHQLVCIGIRPIIFFLLLLGSSQSWKFQWQLNGAASEVVEAMERHRKRERIRKEKNEGLHGNGWTTSKRRLIFEKLVVKKMMLRKRGDANFLRGFDMGKWWDFSGKTEHGGLFWRKEVFRLKRCERRVRKRHSGRKKLQKTSLEEKQRARWGDFESKNREIEGESKK